MIPLSYAQRRLWFLQHLHGADATDNLPVALRFTGVLDEDALRAAVADVVARHDLLRTVFVEADGVPRQRQLPPAQGPGLSVVDTVETDLDTALRDAAVRPFDVGTTPPLRATLFRPGGAEPVLLLVCHHIVADGWSLSVLLRDLASAYRARELGVAPPWRELAIRYADYVWWQQELLGDADDPDSLRNRQLGYWRRVLAGLPAVLDLPTDRPRPAVASRDSGAVPVRWAPERHAAMLSLARARGCTLFMVIQAALAVLLSRMGGGDDVPIGSVVAGRTEQDLEDLVGLFVNTVVVRADLSGTPDFDEVLKRVRVANLAAQDHQDLPFDLLVESVNPARTLAHHPLFQVLLALETGVETRLDFGRAAAVRTEVPVPAAKVDLTLQLTDHYGPGGMPAGITGYLEYATDLFDAETVRDLVARLSLVLDTVIAEPTARVADIDLLLPVERDRLTLARTATDRRMPVTTLHAEIAAQAHRTPTAPAVIDGDRILSYADVNTRAGRLARHLIALGVRTGSVVGVALPRSADLVVALLAVLRTGAAYLPLDPDYPERRLAFMIDDAGPVCVLTDHGTAQRLPAGTRTVVVPDSLDRPGAVDGGPDAPLPAAHPAYVIYTSGSTGAPKGVVVSHRAIDNRLRWMQEAYPLGPDDRVLQKTSISFDVSVWELFWPLRVGATLVMAAPGEQRDPARLARTIRQRQVTVAHFVPAMLRLFLSEPAAAGCTELRRLICSGEALARETAAEVHRLLPGTALENLYGPTEAAVDVTAHSCRPGETGPVPIGRPVFNTRVHVLDERLRQCPAGVPGELYLAGAQLADGYLGRAALTSSRFVADPYDGAGARMYRTGDLVRRHRDGVLEFLGRTDGQVKLRGQRIELGEIEHVLLAAGRVGAACVVVRDGTDGEPVLAAYVAAVPDGTGPADLRDLLARHLPETMVPATVTVLPSLPLTDNGKIDRSALPAPRVARVSGGPPRSATEREVARAVEETLRITGVGVDDDFFALGGHSLLAVRLVRRIREITGVELHVQEVFRDSSVSGLARRLAGTVPALAPSALLEVRRADHGTPLILVHPGSGLSWCYYRLAEHLGLDRPVLALQARGLAAPGLALPTSIGEMADDYLDRIREVQAQGPYQLAGWSFGGHVAHAMAVRLRKAGQPVTLLAVLDAYPDSADGQPDGEAELRRTVLENLLGRPPARVDQADFAAVADLVREGSPPLADASDSAVRAALRVGLNNLRLQQRWTPEMFDGDLTLITAARERRPLVAPAEAWRPFVAGRVTHVTVDAGHHDMCSGAAAQTGAVLGAAARKGSG